MNHFFHPAARPGGWSGGQTPTKGDARMSAWKRILSDEAADADRAEKGPPEGLAIERAEERRYA